MSYLLNLTTRKPGLESWRETLNILSSREEIKAVRQGKKQKTAISHKQLCKNLDVYSIARRQAAYK
ncbi:TPA: hypothetical protein DEQ95_04370 [Candidatus Beckwithbacteria bacterium]|nr:MAG: hypothetical protein UY43_C0001G0110 [Candidatus Beckwithbacteria bacterium GW2011_GWC1_49_16]OGD48512.1 MAG: hypothetical protein A2877_02065 [Candidatus Beckwithbacteria bacterium RIFCSPHIGHO2_01_FULL_49_39]OGD50617.1 MAG: hypothetical protein A3D86_00730 [Candidatus Beckwithbacteria bacterium RIFCSPHIGHO2_02_FULL_49_13]OGD51433.1 MAG: hypothetical protein A3K56_04310 [Candidatus Beckwithbacteria bacterium RIFCSPHIGHO2_12_FULL_49_13]OGD58527.1 MAG: hypothetical protein A3J22_05145 [Ca